MWKRIGHSMRTYTECIPCFVRQAHDALQQVVDDDDVLIHRALQRVLIEAAGFPMERTPPEMAQTIHRIIREESGNPDPYAEIKRESTRLALGLAEEARGIIDGAIDPFKMAVRFAIAGNILDFALISKWRQLDLNDFIEKTRLHQLEEDQVNLFRAEVGQAETILILGDNAGEAVFDRLLIEQLPGKKIYYAVKGAPVINDATLEDACDAGLDLVAELVENGSDAPGTLLNDCSAPFLRLFHAVDLVIAKGQANYETLSHAPRPLFFLTQIKCPVIARTLGGPVGSWIVRKHQGATP